MAYQQTNATSVSDLIDRIVTFAGANGWTVHRNSIVGSGRRATVQKGGDYIHIWDVGTSLFNLRASVNYDSAAAGDLQPNQSVSQAQSNCGSGPFSNVFLFSNSNCIFVAFEISSGIFRHVSFGAIQKFGTFTGGTFFEASYHNTVQPHAVMGSYHHRMFDTDSGNNGFRGGVRCDVDGNANYFAPFCGRAAYGTPVANGGIGPNDASNDSNDGYRTNEAFYQRSINSWSGITPIQPIKIRVERASGYWSEIGEVPGIRFLNMSRFQPGDEFTIGSDVWKVFPFTRKGDDPTGTQVYSSEYAFAYLKV